VPFAGLALLKELLGDGITTAHHRRGDERPREVYPAS
jgi:hypothetical protein